MMENGTEMGIQTGSNESSVWVVRDCPVENPVGFLLCSQESGELVGTVLKGTALCLLILFTIFGNVLVLMAVALSRNLRSSTHYLIVNLAVADLLLGTTVLPFSAAFEVTGRWYFGQTFCTIWAAVDVLCCTSSILSLCVISLDRYIGVTRPLAYSTIMVGRRTWFLILVIWAASVAISIGPLLGWKEPPSDDPYFCTVNKQTGYVLFSVTGSFYLPMLIIIFVYWRIYKAAIKQTKFLECGQKTTKQDVTLRVHLGGAAGMNFRMNSNPDLMNRININNIKNAQEKARHNEEVNQVNNLLTLAPLARPEKSSSSSVGGDECNGGAVGVSGGDPGVVLRIHRGGRGGTDMAWNGVTKLQQQQGQKNCNRNGAGNRSSPRRLNNGFVSGAKNVHQILTPGGIPNGLREGMSQGNSSTPSPPSSSPERKLNPGFGKIAKFRRQKKAAKTLAIVVGVFLGCWFPFFFVLPLGALCGACNIPQWMFDLFFWLGYFNSCLNPVIYGCTSREFQRAFRRILCRHSPPRPHLSRAIYRANMCNNNRFGDRNGANGLTNHNISHNINNANNVMIPLNNWN